MPDMVHSVAYEPNVNSYYYYHTWGTSAEIAKLSAPRFPVKGSIARGGISISDSAHAAMYTGSLSSNAIHTPVNGSVNYYYGNTEEERLRASREITTNKVKLTTAGLNEGKLLYNIYCGICHGEKGDGAGYLVRDDGGKYPAQPANFLKDEFIAASEGIPSYDEYLATMERTFIDHWMDTWPDFQDTHKYPLDHFGEANMTLCSNALAHRFGCLAFTIEMPFKDNADMPDRLYGWSDERSRMLGGSVLTPVLLVLKDLR